MEWQALPVLTLNQQESQVPVAMDVKKAVAVPETQAALRAAVMTAMKGKRE